ncbi:ribosomal RNA processing protein 36 homolog [Trichonephila clavipes]|nr:ribosomal RNA processing protein 36 homolog [Trichonephila clavipes]
MSFKRENKNRPREQSSKKPVPVFREVFQVKKRHHRDPRFDDLSGSYNPRIFEENYEFIKDIKEREKKELEKELENVGENETTKKKKLKYLLQRMENQERNRKLLAKQKEEQLKEQEEIMEAAKQGKKPYIPRKTEIKTKQLVETFQSLKKNRQLEKYLERKRKKNFSKDRKRFFE